MNGPRPEAASNLSHFLGVNPICLAEGGFGFAGGVTLLIHRSPPGHVFSVHSTGTHLPNCDTATVGSVYRRFIGSSKARFLCPLCWYTLSKSAPPLSSCIHYKVAFLWPEYNGIPCVFAFGLPLPPSDFSHSLSESLWTPLERWITRPMQKYENIP